MCVSSVFRVSGGSREGGVQGWPALMECLLALCGLWPVMVLQTQGDHQGLLLLLLYLACSVSVTPHRVGHSAIPPQCL